MFRQPRLLVARGFGRLVFAVTRATSRGVHERLEDFVLDRPPSLVVALRDSRDGLHRIVFGHEIANIVVECSDNKSLTKLERKQAQIDHAGHLSKRAKLVKIADKISNVSDIDGAPPAGWSLERKREYYDWAKRVVDQMRGVHPKLEARFDAEYAKRP